MKRGSGCCAGDIYYTSALTSLSDSVSYITFLFSEWRINTYSMKQPDLYYFEAIKMTSQAQSNFVWRIRAEYSL